MLRWTSAKTATNAVTTRAATAAVATSREPAVAPVRHDECLRVCVTGTPREDRRREHVVVDLVALLVRGPQNAAGGEGVEDLTRLAFRHVRVSRQIARRVRNLGARRGDELPQQVGGHLLLRGREGVHRTLQVGGDDLLCATQLLERGGPEHARPVTALDLPDPLHHELEIRRLHRLLARAARHPTASLQAPADASHGHLVEHHLGELRLQRHLLAAELGPALERSLHGGPAGREREAVES